MAPLSPKKPARPQGKAKRKKKVPQRDGLGKYARHLRATRFK